MAPSESSNEPNAADVTAGSAPEESSADSPARRFREQVASKQASLDDYDSEETLWTGGYSGKAMVGTWILLGVVSVALLVAAFLIEPLTWLIAIGVIVVIWVIGLAWYTWRRLGVQYELTTQRFLHRLGVLSRRTDRIEVIDIDDVSYSQGPIERIFNVGTVVITSSDRSHPELTMVGIDSVGDVAGLIDDIRRKERRKRSLHIEQI